MPLRKRCVNPFAVLIKRQLFLLEVTCFGQRVGPLQWRGMRDRPKSLNRRNHADANSKEIWGKGQANLGFDFLFHVENDLIFGGGTLQRSRIVVSATRCAVTQHTQQQHPLCRFIVAKNVDKLSVEA